MNSDTGQPFSRTAFSTLVHLYILRYGSNRSAMANAKPWVVRDAVHGDIRLPSYVRPIVDDPLFQRLRYIKQNGLLYLVFPGAHHTRFEHSIGAAHLADQVFPDILARTERGRDVTVAGGLVLAFGATLRTRRHLAHNRERWRSRLVLAALLHDVGHGPLSHTFERMKVLDASSFIPTPSRKPRTAAARLLPDFLENRLAARDGALHHEDITVAYIEKILRRSDTRCLGDDWIAIAALASSEFRDFVAQRGALPDADIDAITLLAPFVAGTFDVDRTDYLARDSLMAGVNYGRVEGSRILRCLAPVMVRKVGDHARHRRSCGLVARSRDVHALDHFLVCLFEMYTQVYHHPVVMALDHELFELTRGVARRWDARWYETASDLGFFLDLAGPDPARKTLIWRFLHRDLRPPLSERKRKTVVQLLGRSSLEIDGSSARGFRRLEPLQRKLLKEREQTRVWLRSQAGPGKAGLAYSSWREVSLVAARLTDWTFSPETWWRNREVVEAGAELRDEAVSRDGRECLTTLTAERQVVAKRRQQ